MRERRIGLMLTAVLLALIGLRLEMGAVYWVILSVHAVLRCIGLGVKLYKSIDDACK